MSCSHNQQPLFQLFLCPSASSAQSQQQHRSPLSPSHFWLHWQHDERYQTLPILFHNSFNSVISQPPKYTLNKKTLNHLSKYHTVAADGLILTSSTRWRAKPGPFPFISFSYKKKFCLIHSKEWGKLRHFLLKVFWPFKKWYRYRMNTYIFTYDFRMCNIK